jgi:hypothetical protein
MCMPRWLRIPLFTLLLLLLLSSADGAGAAPSLQVQKVINLERAAQRTGLAVLNQVLVVDRGRSVQIAQGRRSGDRARPGMVGHMVRLSDYTQYMLRAPVDLAAEPTRLMFYDGPHRRAGLLVSRKNGAHTDHVYGEWDLGADGLRGLTTLGRTVSRGTQSVVVPVGYAHRSRRFYMAEHRFRTGRPWVTTIVAVDDQAGPLLVAQVEADRRIHGVHFDAVHERALITEYASGAEGDTDATGYLVDLVDGAVRRLPIPPTAYGVAFDRDGRSVLAASNRTGELWRIDVRSGQRRVMSRPGSLSHALGVVDGGLILVRASGIQLLDPTSGRRTARLATKRVFGYAAHTEGSLIVGDTAVISDGTRLAFIKVSASKVSAGPARPASRLR